MIQKRTKRKELADVDIASMIKDFSFTDGEGVVTGTVTVLAQNPGLNPQLLEKAVERYMPDCPRISSASAAASQSGGA